MESENSGYIAFGLNDEFSMRFAELVVANMEDGDVVIYEYVGNDGNMYPNYVPQTKWNLDSFTTNDGRIKTIFMSRSRHCANCLNMELDFYILWAMGNLYS